MIAEVSGILVISIFAAFWLCLFLSFIACLAKRRFLRNWVIIERMLKLLQARSLETMINTLEEAEFFRDCEDSCMDAPPEAFLPKEKYLYLHPKIVADTVSSIIKYCLRLYPKEMVCPPFGKAIFNLPPRRRGRILAEIGRRHPEIKRRMEAEVKRLSGIGCAADEMEYELHVIQSGIDACRGK